MSRFSNSSNFATNTVSPNGFTSLYLRAKQGHLSHLKCVVILPFFCGSTCCLLWKCNTKAAKDVAIWHCNRLWKLIMKVNSRVRAIEGNVDCDPDTVLCPLKTFLHSTSLFTLASKRLCKWLERRALIHLDFKLT